jgi:hypothetical protein
MSSVARFNRRNRLVTKRGHRRLFCKTEFGQAVTLRVFLDPLTDFLAGKFDDKPDDPPRFLGRLISLRQPPAALKHLAQDDALVMGWSDRQLHRALALIALSRLLDGIFRGWDREDPSVYAKTYLGVGEDIYAQMVPPGLNIPFPWTQKDRLLAGEWLLTQAMALDLFDYDEDGFPIVSPKWTPRRGARARRIDPRPSSPSAAIRAAAGLGPFQCVAVCSRLATGNQNGNCRSLQGSRLGTCEGC